MNLQRLRRVMFSLTFGVALGAICGCTAWPYHSSPIRGHVVDSSSGKPLDGVMVVAFWRTNTKGFFHEGFIDSGPGSICMKIANLLTARSGADGVFTIPSWTGTGCFTMYGAEPELIVYRPGYKIQLLFNVDITSSERSGYQSQGPSPGGAWGRVDGGTVFIWTSSKWNGATIKLDPDSDVQTNLARYMNWVLEVAGQEDRTRCFWNEARPALAYAMALEGPNSSWTVENSLRRDYGPDRAGMPTCGSVEDYIQSLSKEAYQLESVSPGEAVGDLSDWDVGTFKLDQAFTDHFRLFFVNVRRYAQAHPDFQKLGSIEELSQDPATRELFSASGITPRDLAVGYTAIGYRYGGLGNMDQQQCLAWAEKFPASVEKERRRDSCLHREELKALRDLWALPIKDWPSETLGSEPTSK